MNRAVLGGIIGVVAIAVVVAIVVIVISLTDQADKKSASFQPDPKKNARAFLIAKEACAVAPKKTFIMAPKRVSQQIRLVPNCAAPFFIDEQSQNLTTSERKARHDLIRYVEFKRDMPFAEMRPFIDALRQYEIRVVVMSQEGVRNHRLKQILRQSGYEKVLMVKENHIWYQKDGWEKVDERHRLAAQEVCRRVDKEARVLAPFALSRQLEKLGCCRPFLTFPTAAYAGDGSNEKLGALEDVLVVFDKPSPYGLGLLAEVLRESPFGAIVLIQQGDGDRRLKTVLSEHEFKMATKRDDYRIWVPDK
ncbi:MAG: hypothetical protein JXA30_08630 [Deltaproteobacteria bacterium]|nr:hypothetical protein [Deltaproteobacteria bacterium]